MYLCYVDESGTGLKDPRGNFFTLAALTVRAQDWQRLDEAVIEYKRWISWAEPEDFELKARDIRHGHGVFRGLEENRRSELLIRMGELIGKLPVTVMAVTVNKRDLPPTIETEEQLYRGAFWRLLDTINELLREVSVPGILIVDSRSDLHTSVQDRRLVDAYRRYVALRKEGSMLVEVPLFGNSEFYSGIQLADFAAHIITLAFQRQYVRLTAPSPLTVLSHRTPEEAAYRAMASQIRKLVTLP